MHKTGPIPAQYSQTTLSSSPFPTSTKKLMAKFGPTQLNQSGGGYPADAKPRPIAQQNVQIAQPAPVSFQRLERIEKQLIELNNCIDRIQERLNLIEQDLI